MQEQVDRNTTFLTRQCNKCQNKMHFNSHVKDSYKFIPWSDKQALFKCESCHHQAAITYNSSVLNNIISGFFILIALCYFLLTGLFEFILYSFTQSFFSILMGVGLTILVILFFVGSLLNIKNGFQQIQTNITYPMFHQTKNSQSNVVYLSLFLGALPIVFSVLLGMIDFYFYPFNEIWVIFLLPIIFSPIIFAYKLKSSVINVFYGTLFWIVLSIVFFYFFK